MINAIYVPGMRITTRGEVFIIKNVIENFDNSFLIDADGISELVKGLQYKFDTNIDNDIKNIDSINTKLIADTVTK